MVDLEFMPVILGGDITAYSLARSFFEEYGIKCIVISLSKNGFTSYSRFIENIIVPDMERREMFLRTLIGIGIKNNDKKLILLACGDWYVRMIVENRNKLPENYVVPYIEKELLDTLVLKDSFYGICDTIGIPHPETFVYDFKNPAPLELPFDYPVIAKPADSARYHYTTFDGKRKVYKIDSERQLAYVLAKVNAGGYDGKFIIQNFVPGDDTNMRILTCYCDKNSDIKFSAFGRVLLEEHGRIAVGNPVAIINSVDNGALQKAAAFLKHVGYTGFANFDLKYDARDGELKFFEINTRLGRSNFYITGSGFSAVKRIVDDLVYGAELEYTVANNKHLYTVVPKQVLLDYVKDSNIRAEIKELYKIKRVSNPIIYKKDKSLFHQLYYFLFTFRQMQTYYNSKRETTS